MILLRNKWKFLSQSYSVTDIFKDKSHKLKKGSASLDSNFTCVSAEGSLADKPFNKGSKDLF